VHPREIEHAGGTVFESVDEPEALEIVRRFVEWSGYHGQIGFDFRRTSRGLFVIECNPRPTAGVHLFAGDLFVDALLSPHDTDPAVVRAGVRAKYSFALLRNIVLHTHEALDDLRHLFSSSREAIAISDDPWPAAYQLASFGVVRSYRERQPARAQRNTDLIAAYFDDISWNGESSRVAA
jgi:predicted ATP-grasp superfamily ATP-dependent carboligase